jgi:hypothetical protein
MIRLFIAAALALLLAALAQAAPVPAAAWKDEATTLGFQIDSFTKCRGRLAEKPRFSGCVQMWADAYRRVNRMEPQASAQPEHAEAMKSLATRLDEASAFMQPEIRRLGRQKVQALLASDKLLAGYREPMDRILKSKTPLDPRELWKP